MVRFTSFLSLLALSSGISSAIPHGILPGTSENPSHVLVARGQPMFNGFDQVPNHEAKIEKGIRDLTKVANVILETLKHDKKTFTKVRKNYFLDEHEPYLVNALTNLVEPDSSKSGEGSDSIAKITFYERNFDPKPGDSDSRMAAYSKSKFTPKGKTASHPAVYIRNDEKLSSFNYPDLEEIKSGNLGDHVSVEMASFPLSVLLHELMHIDLIGYSGVEGYVAKNPLDFAEYNNGIPNEIVDVVITEKKKVKKGKKEVEQLVATKYYGPMMTRQLITSPYAKQAIMNADNFSWFVKELYYTVTCKKDFKPPIDNINVPAEVCKEKGGCELM